ncbi:hypothetical protein PA598K_03332 [Paenibacillus sp. 598K]|uniref:hypothetical protein n=1 Tax=Paenibacillus sp. 598K TaxID=1117987 RepID=UPI000FF922FF|nr:hypothetical protein [Paenibacillus sp. 598K]GBF74959.1 hypothetical protein PA598K_03332 [Paenibacillus sp. 598K]
MKALKSITLEMSLKPFKQMDAVYVEEICRKMFAQWQPLARQADTVSVLLWTSDGSEILDYDGHMETELEWAKYIGGATALERWDRINDPDGIGLHTRSYLYTEQPPLLTYGLLSRIISTLKRVGAELLIKPIRVGATFDPGPEFAKSSFKYERHPEICMGDTMGPRSFVCSYATLRGDERAYASFPYGIPDGTPFGTFFGRQCQAFLTDLGFDYLWLSNGFGFGTETWGVTGAIFDGERFHEERVADTQQQILTFWRLFRQECPGFPIETRGTNLTAGIDLSTDGVPLQAIYEGGFDILPPPNSPWAALNGDFGLELAGYMSRIAELPGGDDFLYRFYIHDPWWMNSPWLDRYEGQPHDIYLPLAICRINGQGEVKGPSHLNLLTVDNCLGELPEQVPSEVIPHLMQAYACEPDAPAPVVWVYPFREYHEGAMAEQPDVARPFFEDWLIRGAINHGLPISTVVSSDNFAATAQRTPGLYRGSVIVTPLPTAGSLWERDLLGWIEAGGQAILYGSARHAGARMLEALNLAVAEPIDGELAWELRLPDDALQRGVWPQRIRHRAAFSDGGIDAVLRDAADVGTTVAAYAGAGEAQRVAALIRRQPAWQGGAVAWLRGANGNRSEPGEHLLIPDDPAVYYPVERLLRLLLAELGPGYRFAKADPRAVGMAITTHRSAGAFYFSGYVPDTTVDLLLRYPMGAPLLIGWETRLEAGYARYRLPRAWQAECRVFVQQEGSALISCQEYPAVSIVMQRRIRVRGLQSATLTIFPQAGFEHTTQVLLNSKHPYVIGEAADSRLTDTPWGLAIIVEDVTGEVLVSTPFAEPIMQPE